VKRALLLQESLTWTTTVNFSFQTFGGKRLTLGGNTTFAATGHLFGAYLIIRIICDGTLRTLTWPIGWRWVGAAAPANIAAGKTALLRLWSFGTNDNEVVARWLVEP